MSAVDLSKLPPPQVVEELEYEAILAEALADLQARGEGDYDTLLESDPAVKVLEVMAYRELLIRQRANEGALAIMLAFAEEADLDHLGALYGVQRLAGESDTAYRARIQAAPEGFSVAGPVGAYRAHALAADALIADVAVTSPTPGRVLVSVLAHAGDGTPTQDTLDAVVAALSAEDVRPLTDTVEVQAAEIQTYVVTVELTLYEGADLEVNRQASEDALIAYVDTARALGWDLLLEALSATARVPGVKRVHLMEPMADLPRAEHQAAHCTAVTVTVRDLEAP